MLEDLQKKMTSLKSIRDKMRPMVERVAFKVYLLVIWLSNHTNINLAKV